MKTTVPSGLFLHRATGTAALARGLADTLADPLDDPFIPELVSVPTPGVERWLSQALAGHLGSSGQGDGVSAGIDFLRLEQLVRRVVEGTLGLDPATDPWRGERIVWAILRILDANLGQPWAGPVRAHLDPRVPTSRRYATAARVATLFRSYAAQRPELLRDWRAGRAVDPSGAALDQHAQWQHELWTALRDDLGGPDPEERMARTAALLADDPGRLDLPDRLSVFGPTRLDTSQLTVLAALAHHRSVHLWLPHPSPVLWERVRNATSGAYRGERSADPTALIPRHRLTRRLARDARELQLVLGDLAIDSTVAEEPTPAPSTVLQRLQAAIRDDVESPARLPIAPEDDSIRLHVCHGPDRQVEVLREVVLGLLADHPDLEPRDILVMCPDIDRFAPLVSATFALDTPADGMGHPGQDLKVRLADRSLRELNPLLATLQSLLALGDSRAGASDLLDLCADPPIARRFGFTDTHLERLRELVPRSGVRWGLDLAHRERFSMGGYGQNTWMAGLERMLLGVAMDDRDQHVQGTVLPMGEVESSDVDLIGRLVEFVHRLRRIVASFNGPRTLPAWTAACREALDLVTDVAAVDIWQRTHAWTELTELAETAEADTDVLLSPADLRAVLADAFTGRPSRANFRTGALTLCTLSPMRSVPHRAVVLLGLDDGMFPRRGHADGDDLLAATPWVGDRDPRSEDRQILLDAVLAAGDHLLVIHSGASPQTGERRPPAVPLAEVRGAIEDLTDGDPWERLEVRHPLQPFAVANFHPAPFSFDARAARAAAALIRSRTAPVQAVPQALTDTRLPMPPELEQEVVPVELADLLTFFANPARGLLRRRAQIYVGNEDESKPDEIPIDPDGLERWAIGDRMLRAHLGGAELEDIRTAEFCRGEVPPRQRGIDLLNAVEQDVRKIRAAADPWLTAPATSQWVSIDLGRFRLSGMVSGIRDRKIVRVGFGGVRGKQRLRAWIELLALKATCPDVVWRSVVLGKGGDGSILGPVAEVDARARLNDLLQLWVRGLCELLPLPPNTALAQVQANRPGGNRWGPEDAWKNECDAAWERFGLRPRYLSTLKHRPATAADGRGSGSAFEVLAHRVFDPLIAEEGTL
ncbi:exodeoxyribonuclease V subunit gamma [Granulicoccus sp. GXG6511]|uniref:exodeoxyribonuclease V subunit gamma n=1 Tax=Granulicoccus sp. GXG6511 TaxID=3381351 RepID=UPI003D7CAF9B